MVQKRIYLKLHKFGTYDVCKISLACFDDKRYILRDGINSFAYFQRYKRSIKLGKVDRFNEVNRFRELTGLIESNQVNKKFTTCALFLGIISVVYIVRDQGQNYLFFLVVY